MPLGNYVRVTHYPNIKFDDFNTPHQDVRYLRPLRNLFEILDQLHIRYVYVTATATIGDKESDTMGKCKYEKEVDMGLYLPDLNLILNMPAMGAIGLFLNEGAISLSQLKMKNALDNISEVYKFLNGKDFPKN